MTWYLWNTVAMHYDMARRCPWMKYPFMERQETPFDVINRLSAKEVFG